MRAEEKLKELGLSIRESDNPDRDTVDFTIEDAEDNVVWVWGTPEDYEVECPHDFTDYEDDETVGECPICGATCDWHWETDENGRYRVPHEWHKGNGGIIKQYIKEQYGK